MALSITSRLIIDAAQARGWRAEIIREEYSLYRLILPDGSYYYLRNIASNKSGVVNSLIAEKKDVLYALTEELGVRIPQTTLAVDRTKTLDLLAKHKQIVIKPVDCAHGDGVTVNITNGDELAEALKYARKFSGTLIAQQQISGDDHRLLFIDGKLSAACIRKPAFVIGDGTSTVRELIEAENTSALRQDGYQETLTSIDITDAARYLGNSIDTMIPEKGEEVRVMGTANIGKGGAAIDITDTIDKSIVAEAQKIVNHLQIGLAGVDFIVDAAGKAYFIEINTVPSLGLHEFPCKGKKRNTPDAFLNWLTKETPA